MFSVCKQTHQPTGVEHAISCFFFNKTEKSLVTAGANILKVFRLIPNVEQKIKQERYSGKYIEPVVKFTLCGFRLYLLFGSLIQFESFALL